MKLAGLNRTPIEWAQNPDGTQGYTLNVFTGCLNHNNGKCKGGNFPCYAYGLANGRLKSRYLANKNLAPVYAEGGELYTRANNMIAIDPFFPRFWEDRMDTLHQLRYIEKPMGVFLCDMSDWAGRGIPSLWQLDLLDGIKNSPQHRFYLLTKQPQNLAQFSPFPDNCWVGVTITNEAQAIEAVSPLCRIKAKVKYISFEPLLGRIRWQDLSFANWVIIGAQTKPYRPPKWEWVKEIISVCADADTPYFLKNNLEPIIPKVFGGDGNLIQEMPEVK